MWVAVVGSRDYPDWKAVREYVESLPEGTTVVSGGARGVDSWAERAALACGLDTRIFPADWDQFGKRAGFMRNEMIVECADLVVAFWDGQSKGTLHSINLAKRLGKPVEVYVSVPAEGTVSEPSEG